MSIQDLRLRLRDIPGTENLSMGLEAGRIVLKWSDGYSAAVDAAASDSDIEAAVRNAAKLPPVSLIPDRPAAPVAAPAPAASSTHSPGGAASAVQDLMAEHVRLTRDIHAASLETLRASLARQRDAMSGAVGNVASKVDRQTDDFLAMMGQFTNEF